MPDVKRTVKLVTQQHVLPDEPQEVEGFPMRAWEISIYLMDADGNEIPATCFEKATYVLHESFGKRARQAVKTPPFTIREKGWGEFDMLIHLTPVGNPKGGDQTISHDLNFSQEKYESTHIVTFRNPKPELLNVLKESGPAETHGSTTKTQKRKPASRNVDMEKLAEALPQLQEEDLLQVVQMVHDNKSEDTYTKNDLENGEWHVDLYTLPDNLIKMLWDFTSEFYSDSSRLARAAIKARAFAFGLWRCEYDPDRTHDRTHICVVSLSNSVCKSRVGVGTRWLMSMLRLKESFVAYVRWTEGV